MEIVVMVQQYSMIQSNPIIVIYVCHKMEYMNTKNVNIRYLRRLRYTKYQYYVHTKSFDAKKEGTCWTVSFE